MTHMINRSTQANKGTILASDFPEEPNSADNHSTDTNSVRNNESEPAAQGTFSQQREALHEKMQAQRARMSRQVNPAFSTDSGFPRSQTMRLLLRRPDLLSALLKMLGVLLMKLVAVLIRVLHTKR